MTLNMTPEVLIMAILLIAFEAIYEGLKARKFHIASEIVEFVYLFLITSVAFLWLLNITWITVWYIPAYKVIIGYIFLRFAIFDFIWNLSAGQSLFYRGKTKLFDKIFAKVPTNFLTFVKIILFIISIVWLLNYEK